MSEPFEPKIVGFLCNWCSYPGSDLAGVMRLTYPPNIRIVRIMCTGRLDSALILKAFLEGADGVLISGCHLGDCYYLTGNEKALIVTENTRKLIETIGLGEDRLKMVHVSASEGPDWAKTAKEFTEQIRELGPSPLTSH